MLAEKPRRTKAHAPFASRGDEDHLVTSLDALGKRHMWQLAIKPGRPMTFGQIGKTIVLALPGTETTEMSVPFGAAHGEQIDLGSGGIAPVAVENEKSVSVIVPMSNGVTFPVLIIPG